MCIYWETPSHLPLSQVAALRAGGLEFLSDARAFRMRLDAYAANQAQISPVFQGSGVVLRVDASAAPDVIHAEIIQVLASDAE